MASFFVLFINRLKYIGAVPSLSTPAWTCLSQSTPSRRFPYASTSFLSFSLNFCECDRMFWTHLVFTCFWILSQFLPYVRRASRNRLCSSCDHRPLLNSPCPWTEFCFFAASKALGDLLYSICWATAISWSLESRWFGWFSRVRSWACCCSLADSDSILKIWLGDCGSSSY